MAVPRPAFASSSTGPAAGGRCILVLVDLSPRDGALLQEAIHLAVLWGSPVHLLFVAEDPHHTGGMEHELKAWVERVRRANLDAQHRLALEVRRLRRRGLRVEMTVTEGCTRQSIIAFLRLHPPSVVIFHQRPAHAQREALRHGIRSSVLASGGWLIPVPGWKGLRSWNLELPQHR